MRLVTTPRRLVSPVRTGAVDPSTAGPHLKIRTDRSWSSNAYVARVETPRWMIGDSEFDMLGWHDHLLRQAVVPIAPYNPRNTSDPHDIDYRVEEQIKEPCGTVRLWQKQLKETYSHRSQVETAIGVCKDLGLGPVGSEAE
jgi:hypothetical protein